jgi:uncharacterized protein
MIVVDTGPIVALLNDRDDQHERCRDFLANYPGPLLVPTTVFTEVCMLVERRRGTRAELAFLSDVRSGLFTMLDPRPPTSTVFLNLLRRTPTCRSEQSMRQSSLLPNDLIYRRLTERALDHRHFSVVRPRNVPAFELLP